jgi:phage portal protein BeeE
MVLGLGAGLDRSTYSNYEAAQQAAWEDGMIPTLRALSETLTVQLLPDFTEDPREYLAFDYEKVRALADDVNALAVRSERLYRSGIIDRAQAKRLVGIEPNPDDEGVLSNNATSEIPGAVTDTAKPQDMQKTVGREVPYQSIPFSGYELLPDR